MGRVLVTEWGAALRTRYLELEKANKQAGVITTRMELAKLMGFTTTAPLDAIANGRIQKSRLAYILLFGLGIEEANPATMPQAAPSGYRQIISQQEVDGILEDVQPTVRELREKLVIPWLALDKTEVEEESAVEQEDMDDKSYLIAAINRLIEVQQRQDERIAELTARINELTAQQGGSTEVSPEPLTEAQLILHMRRLLAEQRDSITRSLKTELDSVKATLREMGSSKREGRLTPEMVKLMNLVESIYRSVDTIETRTRI